MKTVILFIIFLASGICYGQITNTVFDLDTSTKIYIDPLNHGNGLYGTLITEVAKRNVHKTASGQYYIEVPQPVGIDPNLSTASKRFYLGWLYQAKGYENRSVFTNSTKSSFWYFQLSTKNQLTKIYLPNSIMK